MSEEFDWETVFVIGLSSAFKFLLLFVFIASVLDLFVFIFDESLDIEKDELALVSGFSCFIGFNAENFSSLVGFEIDFSSLGFNIFLFSSLIAFSSLAFGIFLFSSFFSIFLKRSSLIRGTDFLGISFCFWFKEGFVELFISFKKGLSFLSNGFVLIDFFISLFVVVLLGLSNFDNKAKKFVFLPQLKLMAYVHLLF